MLFVRNGLRSDVFVTSGKMPGRFVRIDSNNSLSTIRPPTLCFAGPSACSLQLLIAFRFAEFFRPPRNRHFSDFSRPCASTAVLPSIALGGKRYFRGPFFSTSCEFPNYVPPRKSGQKRGGVWYLLGNSGQNCHGCEKKARFVVPRAGRLKVARQFSRGDAATRRKVLPAGLSSTFPLSPSALRASPFALRLP